MELPLVESLTLAEREQVQLVAVVPDEGDLRAHRLSIDREPDAARVPHEHGQRPQPGECDPPATMVLTPMDEVGVEAQGDVVQEQAVADAADVDAALLTLHERAEGADRVVAVETDVPRKVVPRAERDADEREVALDRHLCDRRERSVAAGDAERVGLGGAGELGRIVGLRMEYVRLDAAAAGLLDKVLRARIVVTRARVDQQEARQAWLGLDGLEA